MGSGDSTVAVIEMDDRRKSQSGDGGAAERFRRLLVEVVGTMPSGLPLLWWLGVDPYERRSALLD